MVSGEALFLFADNKLLLVSSRGRGGDRSLSLTHRHPIHEDLSQNSKASQRPPPPNTSHPQIWGGVRPKYPSTAQGYGEELGVIWTVVMETIHLPLRGRAISEPFWNRLSFLMHVLYYLIDPKLNNLGHSVICLKPDIHAVLKYTTRNYTAHDHGTRTLNEALICYLY